eukprot:INCI3729.1.p1 GENE.INCI3729.1~~INCI3729.1.p1  ORF type:complete len:1103 (-),score=306.17 INCI3729.1:172-3480(-)
MDKSGQRSRGFGYAQYATVDGATAALVELNGKELQGRRIVIQRPREKTDEAKQKKKQERKAQKKLKASLLQAGGDGDDDDDNDDDDGVKTIEIEDVDEDAQDAAGAQSAAAELRKSQDSAQDSVAKLRRAGRTVLIWGLPSAAPEFVKKFEKSVGSCGKVDQVIVPAAVPLTVQEHLSICAEVAFVNKVSTKTAVRKFDRQQWNVATGNRDNTKKSKASAAADRISFVRLLASMAQTAKARKSCRLIVRNLTFKATRKDVVDAFARFGPIAQVHMPDAAESLDERKKGGKQAKHRGFAFVQFLFKQDAVRALKAVNMTNIKGRPVAVDWMATTSSAAQADQTPSLTELSDMQIKADDDEQPNDEDEDRASGDEGSDEENADGKEHTDGSDDEESDEAEGDEDEDDDGDDEDANQETKARAKTPLSDVGDAVKGTTLFLCNLALSTSRRQLSSVFKDFGSLKSIYLVRDRSSGAFRGSAFVQFRDQKSADAALERYAYDQPKGQYSHKYRDTDKAGQSIVDANEKAQPEATPRLVLDGRAIVVRRAVDRETSSRLAAAGEKRRKDKRNMYLLEEGHVAAGSTAAEGLTDREIEKRQASMRERRQRLQKSPVFFVSPTRLAIQNMNTTGDVHLQQKLKKIFTQATRDGFKHGLVTREDGPIVAQMLEDAKCLLQKVQSKLAKKQRQRLAKLDGPGRHEADKKVLDKYFDSMKVLLRQVSVVRDPSRLDAKGQPRCRGFAFIEFEHHPHALAALRMVNNNPAFSSMAQRGERLHVQFALENHKVLKDRQRQKELLLERQADPLAHGHGIESAHLSKRDGLELFGGDAKASSVTAAGSAGARRDVAGLTKKERRTQRRIAKRKLQKEEKRKQRELQEQESQEQKSHANATTDEAPAAKKTKKNKQNKSKSAKGSPVQEPTQTQQNEPALEPRSQQAQQQHRDDLLVGGESAVNGDPAAATSSNRSRRKRARAEAQAAAKEEAELLKVYRGDQDSTAEQSEGNGDSRKNTSANSGQKRGKQRKNKKSQKDAAKTAGAAAESSSKPSAGTTTSGSSEAKEALARKIRERMEARKAKGGRRLTKPADSGAAGGIVLVSKAKTLESRWFD